MKFRFSPSRAIVVICAVVLTMTGIVSTASLLEGRFVFEDLPLIGGVGGSSFSRECPDNHVLTGIRYRNGLLLDAIGIKCRPVRADGTLGAEISSGTMAGGSGGTFGSASCGSNAVVARERGLSGGVGINKLYLYCFEWFPASKTFGGTYLSSLHAVGSGWTFTEHTCSAAGQPATGIKGKHGSIVDAVGLHCSTP